jgi:hypothetical protein
MTKPKPYLPKGPCGPREGFTAGGKRTRTADIRHRVSNRFIHTSSFSIYPPFDSFHMEAAEDPEKSSYQMGRIHRKEQMISQKAGYVQSLPPEHSLQLSSYCALRWAIPTCIIPPLLTSLRPYRILVNIKGSKWGRIV